MNFASVAAQLIEKNGIFYNKKVSAVSYPDDGNEACFLIEENSFWFLHRNKCIIEGVLKYAPNNFFFDIGGGNGFVAKGLENAGVPTVLIEPGIQGCLNAKKRNLANVICSTLEDVNFDMNSIPSIGLFDVVEHIENDIQFLKIIHTYLRVDGFVFITVPAFQSLWSNEDVDAGHYRRYTIKELEEKLKEAGFSIKYSTYLFSILPPAIFLFRTLPSKLGLNKRSNNISKHQNEHRSPKGMISKIMDRLWRAEAERIKRGKKIPFGGSCFIIAKKG